MSKAKRIRQALTALLASLAIVAASSSVLGHRGPGGSPVQLANKNGHS